MAIIRLPNEYAYSEFGREFKPLQNTPGSNRTIRTHLKNLGATTHTVGGIEQPMETNHNVIPVENRADSHGATLIFTTEVDLMASDAYLSELLGYLDALDGQERKDALLAMLTLSRCR